MNNEIREVLKYELICQDSYTEATKDIIVVVHNQLEYVRQCIESVQRHTKLYNLWIWDNRSSQETREYLESLDNVNLIVKDRNYGFIEPNNEIAKLCQSEYIILLNSDTIVSSGWDEALIGYLQSNIHTKLIGYMGGVLDEKGLGLGAAYGNLIDYVMGWCMCLSKQTYETFGLFNEELQFAYFEDSDLSLRIKSSHSIYALHLRYVHHFGNITVRSLNAADYQDTFNNNQKIFASHWGKYLEVERVLAQKSNGLI